MHHCVTRAVLIIRTGFSYHNMCAMFSAGESRVPSKAFDAWLGNVMAGLVACCTADLLKLG